MPIVEQFLNAYQPDIICLQETKCSNDQFPSKPLKALGYQHLAIHGQKGYHGVAIASRIPITEIVSRDYCQVGDARHVSVIFEKAGRKIRLHNFYVPAGGDEPDRSINPKFGHKLDFVEEMKLLHAEADEGVSSILVGDLNIAPFEEDVWSHKQLLKIVSHTPIEVEHLGETQDAGGWVDITRKDIPEGLLYSWWSYRSPDWAGADKGRRLDHIWATPDIASAGHGSRVLRAARGWEQPSDHAPVFASFDL
jgi:exodeoxyribonuclease III